MKKLISIILVLVAIFGLVASGLSAKAAWDTKEHYSEAGKINDENIKAFNDNLALLEENEPAYLEGRSQLEAGKASLEQAKQLIDGLDQLQTGFTGWQEGCSGLSTFAAAAGLEAPSAENVAVFDAAIEQAGVEELKGVPQAIADGKTELAAGLSDLINGVMANEDMAAAVEQAAGMSADQINQTVAALPELPYDQFEGAMTAFLQAAGSLGEGVKQQIEGGEAQLADGEAQLKQFEDGRDAFIAEAIEPVLANPADPGLTSIKDRLGEGFTYLKENGDLDIPAAKKVSEAWRAYSDDSGKVITKEVVARVVGAALILLASLIALIAAIRGLRGKGGKLASFLAALLGCGGVAALCIGGDYYTKQAAEAKSFNAFVPIILAAGIAVGAMALIHVFSAPKAKKQ